MNRRQFIATVGSAAAWPLGVHGQQSEMPLVAVLMATAADDPDSQDRFQAFLKSLDNAGWRQGKNLRVENRWIAGDPDRARAYAAELVGMRPNVILANTALALQPLKNETDSIPIVFVLVYDPVTSGFVSSLAHPGGNVTGFTLGEFSLGGKMMEALNQVAPEIDHVSVVMNPDQRPHVEMWHAIEEGAPRFSV